MAQDNISKFYEAFNAKYDNFGSEQEFRDFLKNANRENINNLYNAFNSAYDNFGSSEEMVSYLGWSDASSDQPTSQGPSREEVVAQRSEQRKNAQEGRALFDRMRQSRTPATSSMPESMRNLPATRTATPKPEPVQEEPAAEEPATPAGPSREELEAELAKVQQENYPIVAEYERRKNDLYNNDIASMALVQSESVWLNEHRGEYEQAKQRIAEARRPIEQMEAQEFEENRERKKAELKAKRQAEQEKLDEGWRKAVMSGPRGSIPFNAGNKEEREEDLNASAASSLYAQAEQVWNQGSKYDEGYSGNDLEKLWTAAKQYVGGAANNIDMGSFTMGLTEGSASLQARKAGDKKTRIVNETLKDMGLTDAGVDRMLKSMDEQAGKLRPLEESLASLGSELKNMEATLGDLAKSGDEGAYRAYYDKYRKKFGEYDKLYKEYEPLRGEYDKNLKQYETLQSAIEANTDKGLTEGEKSVLDALDEFLEAKVAREGNVSIASQAGAGAEQSLEFMLDFILTGGLGKAGTKVATKLTADRLLKKFGREALEKAVVKPGIGMQIAADAVTSAARTAIMFPRNLQAYGEQLTQMTGGKDQFGRYQFDRSRRNAALNTALTQYIEYWSEGFGEYFGAAERAMFKSVTKRAPVEAIGKTLGNYRGSIGKYLDYGKFDGMFNEMLEEVVGSTFNSLAGWMSGDRVGDQEALKEFFAGENLATLALSFLPMSAVSAGTNMRAYKKMKDRYDAGAEMLNGFIESGAIDREDLDAVVSGLPNMTPEQVKDHIVEITDKARESNGGRLPKDFTQNLLGYLEGSFAMDLRHDEWEDSAVKIDVVNAYENQYVNRDVNAAWDLAQEESEARSAAMQQGFSGDFLDKDSYMLAQEALVLMNTGDSRASSLMEYATAKAASDGLRDGYAEETAELSSQQGELIEGFAVNGNIIQAPYANGESVFITSKDVTVGADGKLNTPTGPDGLVTYVAPTGQAFQAKASVFSDVTETPLDSYLFEQEEQFSAERQAAFEAARNTISPSGMAQAVSGRIGQAVFITDRNGVYEPVRIERTTNGGAGVVISGDKDVLQGVAMSMGMNPPAGTMLEVDTVRLYQMLAKDDDGGISSQRPEGAAQVSEPTAPVSAAPAQGAEDLSGTTQTITLNGVPTDVYVEQQDGTSVMYSYEDENGEPKSGTMPVADFRQAMQGTAVPSAEAPVSETPAPAPEPAETQAGTIPVDEKTGKKVYDDPSVTPLMAYDDLYGNVEEGSKNEENRDKWVTRKSAEADKALADAEKLIAEADAEKAKIENWDIRDNEDLEDLEARKEKERAKIDERVGDTQAELPELRRKADFWKQLAEVASDNTASRQREAERQALVVDGIDTSSFDLTPQTVEEAVAEYLGNSEKLIDLDDAIRETLGRRKDNRVPVELFRHTGAHGILVKNGGRSVQDVANDIVGEYENTLAITQDDVRTAIIDALLGKTKTELRETIFNNRLEQARNAADMFREEPAPVEEPAPAPVVEEPEPTPEPEPQPEPVSEPETPAEEPAEEPVEEPEQPAEEAPAEEPETVTDEQDVAEETTEDALGENETQEIRDAVDAIVSGKDKKKRTINDSLPADYEIAGKDVNSYIRDRYDKFKAPLEKRHEELRKEYVAYRTRVEEQAKKDILARNPHIKEDNPHLPDYVSEEAGKRLKNDSRFNELDSQITAIDNEIGNFQERRYNAVAAISEIYAKTVEKPSESPENSVTLEGEEEAREKFTDTVANRLIASIASGERPYKSINDLRREASQSGMVVDERGATDILLQELAEVAIVRAARSISEQNGIKSKKAFENICRLYDMQPTISMRSSQRVAMQQYSTPVPMAFVAQRFVYNGFMNDILEPTAGNGMLVFGIPTEKVHANELDETRKANLDKQGFKEVTQNDATEPFSGKYDGVIANPPFGSHDAVQFDGKSISGLDPIITLRALDAMKDDGRAAIIIGGNVEWADNGSWKTKKAFFSYLYDHYNVKGVVNMGGQLYNKQGTNYPTMMILIDGRRSEAERAASTVYPPVRDKARGIATTNDELFDLVTEILNDNRKTDGNEVVRTQGERKPADRLGQTGSLFAGDDSVESPSDGTDGGRGENGGGGVQSPRRNDVAGENRQDETVEGRPGGERPGSVRDVPAEEPGEVAERSADSGGEGVPGTVPGGRAGTDGRGSEGAPVGDAQREQPESVPGGESAVREPVRVARKIKDKILSYIHHSRARSLESVAPAAMVEDMDASIQKIEKELGRTIDDFVTEELGYNSTAELHKALAAEQIDSVAMAIYQMKQGKAMIIGDQTGVGKGRQVAALIRWANRQGKKPVFMTQKAGLFSDIYRDLRDIGSGDLNPLILNSATMETDKETGEKHWSDTSGVMLDEDGNVKYRSPKSGLDKIIESGKVPDEYDFVVLTYSQLNNGDQQSRSESKKKVKDGTNPKVFAKAAFVRQIVNDNYILLDESHTAAGEDSNSGAFLRSVMPSVKGVTFSSATFAKRPDTMPLYAIKSAMSEANVEPNKLIAMIKKGGVTLQEIMSRALTRSGQMVRRERDMSDVKTDWKTVDDPATAKKARANYDRAIEIFNKIIQFQRNFITPVIDDISRDLAEMASSASETSGTKNFGVDNPPFVSQTYNFTKQLMLALKAEAIVDEVVKEIKAGRHPVIALENTYESGLDAYAVGDKIEDTSFSAGLLRSLGRILQYTVTDPDGNKSQEFLTPEELGPEAAKQYYALQDEIREATKGIFLSPLDLIKERLTGMGYNVGEVTGRKTHVVKEDDGYYRRERVADAKQAVRDFNSGASDVIIINKSGSTGISLHSSVAFKDQRPRSMIIAQPLGDINDYMQMIGRIDRTGQVHRGYYINLSLPVPAELRFNMMLASKLKSLNANTTTSQESDTGSVEAPDFLNKYGSQVVIEYLRDNPDVFSKLVETGMKLGNKQNAVTTISELENYRAMDEDVQKVTGRIALLPVEEQEKFYADISERYNTLIKYLDETGENTLKITTLPLKAKTLARRVGTEGKAPGGDNPFAQNSYVERVEVDVLRKPMKADEIRKVRENLTGGKEFDAYRDELISRVNEQEKTRLAAEEERYNREKEKTQKEIDKQLSALEAKVKNMDEVTRRAEISRITGRLTANLEEKHKSNVASIKSMHRKLREKFEQFNTDDTYLVYEELEGGNLLEEGNAYSPALFCGFKTAKAGENLTPSTSVAVFATLDGRRRLEIKFTSDAILDEISNFTNKNYWTAKNTTIDNWDSSISNASREERYILTGNILQAWDDATKEGILPGRLVSYTDIDGNIHDGILMNQSWQPTQLRSSGAPINSRTEQILGGEDVRSTDGDVEIEHDWGEYYSIYVPKSKKAGAKYFENEEILSLVGRQGFHQYRGRFMASVTRDNLRKLLDILGNMGVRVNTEENESAWEEVGQGTADEERVLYREETDEDILERLDSEPTATAYRAMQFVPDPDGNVEYDLGDGNGMQRGFLYPPMSAKVNGEWREPVPFGTWERSAEQPDLADEKGRFWLDKGNKKGVPAAYNPYFHSSETMLNDQFSEAQSRDNLVVVEVEIPGREVSERNMNPYRAEKAKDSVGRHDWKAGPIQAQLTGTRTVYLSRWDKPVRVVPIGEVAANVAGMIAGQVEVMPTNVVWPQLRVALEKMGVKFVETDNRGMLVGGKNAGKSYSSVYGRKRTNQDAKEAKKARLERDAREEVLRSAERKATDATLDRMSEELGIPINRVSRSEMPRGHQSDKGYYNPATGEMTICMDNVTDERDAIATVLHEAVGHHGLRKLFGDRFNEAMVRIHAALDEKGRRWVNNYIARHNLKPGDAAIILGMEEYLSHLAEQGDYRDTVWNRIKEIFGRIVDALFGTDGFVITDRELNYILRASYENLKDPNWLNTIPGKAKDTLMKRQLGINETDPDKPTDPDGPGTGLLFREGRTKPDNASGWYEKELERSANRMVWEHQNADLPVKIGMEKVMKETGRKSISEDEDYLTRHNLASSRAETEAHDFELFHFTPLLEQVRALQARLIGKKNSDKAEREAAYDRVVDYIYAVSGLERNAYKNAEIEQAKQDALEGKTDAAEIAEIESRYESMKKDWSGITSLMGRPANEWREAEVDAQDMIDAFRREVGSDAELDLLWDRIRSCTDFSLDHAYKYGLLTRDEYEKLHGTSTKPRMWEYYVPLRGFQQDTAEEEYSYATFTGASPNSVVVKKMNGRWTEADNPIANILNIAETEIVQGNDNWAKQALYRFTLNSGKNTLLMEVEPWYVKDPSTGKWSAAEPDEDESLENFESRMKALRELDPPLSKKGRRGLKLESIMVNKAHRNEHMVRLKVGGIDKMIWVNGDPALARAVSGIGRKQNMQWLRRASRVLSNLFTTYSLDFTAKNLIRDTIYSQVGLFMKEDRAYRHQFRKNWIKNLGYGAFAYPMISLAAQWESGKLQTKGNLTPREQAFIDFMHDGGQTGYTIINSVNVIKRDLERSMRRSGEKVGGVTVPILGHYARLVKTLNEAFELLTRFTAYQTSRDMGRSGQRAASDAKEISVNFNRRGAQSGEGFWGGLAAYLGATHYFYNAGVQGFDNFLRLFKASPVKMGTTTAGLVMMGILTPMINSMLAGAAGGGDGDDDWYWNIPEWVRRNNLILGTGRWYLAVPLPVEFRAIYGIGDIAASAFVYDKYPNRTFGAVAGDIVSTASGILPVNPVEGYTGNGNFGDAALRAVAPDAGMFFVDWATNRDYTGRPLWKENPFSKTVPKSQGAYASTPKGIVNACQWLAEQTNGSVDIAPGLVRDFMNNYGGGFFRTAEDVSKVLFGLIGDDPERPFRWDNVPFFSGFTGHIDEDRSNSTSQNALREYKDISEGNVRRMNSILGTDEVTSAILYDNPESLYERDGVSVIQKAKIRRMLESNDYQLGKMYRDGMNNQYKMKQYTRGEKAGQWYKSKEIERKGVNTLKKEWKELREQWSKMPGKTADEKSAKAEMSLRVQDAWHLYYDAEAELAEKLMDYEYGK